MIADLATRSNFTETIAREVAAVLLELAARLDD
jgi:hypothetical protein